MPMTSGAPRLADMNARPATHAGMARPARKKSVLVFMEPFSATPMPSTNAKYNPRISQSIPVILRGSFLTPALQISMGDAIRKKIDAYEPRSVHESRGCRKHLSYSRFAKVPVKIFWFDKSACPLLCSVLFKNSFPSGSNHVGFLISGFDHAIQTDSEWTARHGGRSRGHAALVGDSRCVKSSRHKVRLRNRFLRRLYRTHWRARCTLVPDAGVCRGQRQDHHDRRAFAGRLASGAG